MILLFAGTLAAGGSHQPGSHHSKAKTFRGEIWDSLCAEAGSHKKTEKAYNLPTDTQDCLTTCVERLSAKYVLYNRRSGDIYQLDDQNKLKRYAGRKVKVTGSYDKETHTIYVREIAPAS